MHCYSLLRPLRRYYEKLSKRVNSRDVESGQGNGDDLQSMRSARNQPPVIRPQPYYPPCRQEPTLEWYQYSGTKTFFNQYWLLTDVTGVQYMQFLLGLPIVLKAYLPICYSIVYMTVQYRSILPVIYPVMWQRSQNQSSQRVVIHRILLHSSDFLVYIANRTKSHTEQSTVNLVNFGWFISLLKTVVKLQSIINLSLNMIFIIIN